jgi:hypothetical protein
MNDWVSMASVVFSGIGSAAVAAALLYSSREVKELQAQLEFSQKQAQDLLTAQRAANDLKLMSHAMALDRLFVDHPELRPHIYDGWEIPEEEPQRSSVLATAELVVDLADTVASMMRHGQLHPSDEKAWETALRFWGRSPAVRLMVENDPTGGAWRESTLALLRNTDEPGHPANEFEIREHGLDDEGSGKLAAHESSG